MPRLRERVRPRRPAAAARRRRRRPVLRFWTAPYPERGCARVGDRPARRARRAMAKHPDQLAWTRTGAEVRAAKAAGADRRARRDRGRPGARGRARDDRGVLAARRALPRASCTSRPTRSAGRRRAAARTRAAGSPAFGRDVVRECERCGVIVDLAHINRRGFFEALELATRPPMVSHTGVLGVHEHWRNIDDEQLRAVADKRRLRRHHLRAPLPRLGVDRGGRRSPAPRDRRRRRRRARARLGLRRLRRAARRARGHRGAAEPDRRAVAARRARRACSRRSSAATCCACSTRCPRGGSSRRHDGGASARPRRGPPAGARAAPSSRSRSAASSSARWSARSRSRRACAPARRRTAWRTRAPRPARRAARRDPRLRRRQGDVAPDVGAGPAGARRSR